MGRRRKKSEDIIIEDVYQKKTQIEHILIRPDTYIGSVNVETQKLWVKDKDSQFLVHRKVEFVPGLYKIFDEILVNAADNYRRDNQGTTKIEVWIDRSKSEIRVRNNGRTIPVQIHKEYDIYVSELIFGELLTGSNFNDQKRKVTGGRNGFGAKLANIYSKRFEVITGDKKRKKLLKVIWKDNMGTKMEPILMDYDKFDFTEVVFRPDLKRFKMNEFDDDIIALFHKRVIDLAGILPQRLQVFLNDELLSADSFHKYVKLYFKEQFLKKKETVSLNLNNSQDEHEKDNDFELIYMNTNRWEVGMVLSNTQFQQVSFVNSICTYKGGTHVNYILNQIIESLTAEVKKKNKKAVLKPFMIKNSVFLFVNCLVENPAFGSQTKETLKTPKKGFGSTCQLSKTFLKQIMKCGIIENVLTLAEAKERAQMQRKLRGQKRSRLTGLKKLEDAIWAGTSKSSQCLLILTEGDSAKSLAMAGIEVIGRQKYGVYPLRGKLLNVRGATNTMIMNNKEIADVVKILGLDFNKKYNDIRSLRYGGIMIMTDQDVDGSHIKGLIINLIAYYWPNLLKREGFMVEFVTPLLKAFGPGKQVFSFFTVQEYEHWAKGQDSLDKFTIKYYKGLGTSSNEEARDYFSEFEQHTLQFRYDGEQDLNKLDLIFNKKKADDRKDWLRTYRMRPNQKIFEYSKNCPQLRFALWYGTNGIRENDFIDHSKPDLSYTEFVDKEFIHFSVYSNKRSLPSLIDGFKPGTRKIMYGCFKKNIKKDIKVAQLSGYISEHSAYHHGEASLQSAIEVKFAQRIVGLKNINLLEPKGQFGSRAEGGTDHASARYIYTRLSPLARKLFPEADDHVLTYMIDDGHPVEPKFYVPILPMLLINGAKGLGSGWSTDIPNFSPYDIAQQILRKLQHDTPFETIHPWYRGFFGVIEQADQLKYLSHGSYELDKDDDLLTITELPVKLWTSKYKEFLEKLLDKDETIDDFIEDHRLGRVHFQVRLKRALTRKLTTPKKIRDLFKLTGKMALSNMVLFDENSIIKKYNNVMDIMNKFYDIRLEHYHKRKVYQLSLIERECDILGNKIRFIRMVVDDELVLSKRKLADIVRDLIKEEFTPFSELKQIESTKIQRSDKTKGVIIQDQEGEANEQETGEEDPAENRNPIIFCETKY